MVNLSQESAGCGFESGQAQIGASVGPSGLYRPRRAGLTIRRPDLDQLPYLP